MTTILNQNSQFLTVSESRGGSPSIKNTHADTGHRSQGKYCVKHKIVLSHFEQYPNLQKLCFLPDVFLHHPHSCRHNALPVWVNNSKKPCRRSPLISQGAKPLR